MKKLIALLTFALGLPIFSPIPAHAGKLDHLLCYRMRDPLKIKTAVDMIADLQPEFTQKGCVLVKPVEFCVPATKTNVQPQPFDSGIAGQPLKNDFICYLAKCPLALPPPSKSVADQFGLRDQSQYKPYKVCVPAYKKPRPCSNLSATQCGGACPVGRTCQLNAGVCECLPTNLCGGKPDATGQCGGACTTPGYICQVTLIPGSTKKVCDCGPPPPPPCGLDPATGQCGGTCPNSTDRCTLDSAGKCSCQPVPKPCSLNQATNICSGSCPNPGDICVIDPTGCHCQPPPCSQNTATGLCGGNCPNATDTCALDPSGTGCSCQPIHPPCGSNVAGAACSGTCPNPSETCVTDTTTGKCFCQPSCGGLVPATGVCGGTCPTPDICAPVPGTNQCGCNPPPCGGPVPASGVCGGPCLNPTDTCGQIPGTTQCGCLPAPCGGPVTAAGTCGGTCTNPGDTCTQLPGTNLCGCVPHCGGSPVGGQCNGTCPAPTFCRPDTTQTVCTCQ